MKRIFSLAVISLTLFSAAFLIAGETQQSVKTFKVAKGGLLKIVITSGDIRISTWDRSEVSVRMDDLDDSDTHSVKISQSGNTISVENRGSGWSNSNDVSVSVPKEFNIDAQTYQGDVELKSDITGSVNVFSGGGDINVKNINGRSTLNTNGGDIEGNDFTDDALISTKGGDITVGNIQGNGDLKTLGGSITAGNVTKDLVVSTNGGEIMAGSVGGKLDAKTLGGEIDIKKVSSGCSIKTNGGNIKLGGSGGPVTAKTLGGNIDLNNVGGPVNAETYAGDVYVQLSSVGNTSSNISTMSGWITLYINPSDKATIISRAMGGSYDSKNKSIIADFDPKSYDVNQYTGNTKATYEINGGGPEISIKTMNGGIKIRKFK